MAGESITVSIDFRVVPIFLMALGCGVHHHLEKMVLANSGRRTFLGVNMNGIVKKCKGYCMDMYV